MIRDHLPWARLERPSLAVTSRQRLDLRKRGLVVSSEPTTPASPCPTSAIVSLQCPMACQTSSELSSFSYGPCGRVCHIRLPFEQRHVLSSNTPWSVHLPSPIPPSFNNPTVQSDYRFMFHILSTIPLTVGGSWGGGAFLLSPCMMAILKYAY